MRRFEKLLLMSSLLFAIVFLVSVTGDQVRAAVPNKKDHECKNWVPNGSISGCRDTITKLLISEKCNLSSGQTAISVCFTRIGTECVMTDPLTYVYAYGSFVDIYGINRPCTCTWEKCTGTYHPNPPQ